MSLRANCVETSKILKYLFHRGTFTFFFFITSSKTRGYTTVIYKDKSELICTGCPIFTSVLLSSSYSHKTACSVSRRVFPKQDNAGAKYSYRAAPLLCALSREFNSTRARAHSDTVHQFGNVCLFSYDTKTINHSELYSHLYFKARHRRMMLPNVSPTHSCTSPPHTHTHGIFFDVDDLL